MTASFTIRPLMPEHDRLAFSCGVDALDRYLQQQASQDVKRRISNCFVASPAGSMTIAGYYTLAAASIPLVELPETEAKRLPRYPVVPAALIGRLAVNQQFRGGQLGSALLFAAIKRAATAEPAVFTMIVDAKDDAVVRFYAHFGFTCFASRPMSLYLPIATAVRMMG